MDAKHFIMVEDFGYISFNPRARDGRELATANNKITVAVSIHAPVMDAKTGVWSEQSARIVSIHAPVMDANQKGLGFAIYTDVSIHAPVMDANFLMRIFLHGLRFQSTRP